MNRRGFIAGVAGGIAGAAGVALGAAPLRVRLQGRVVAMDVEDYVADVVTGEASLLRSPEALKAMAVAARTYAARFGGRHADEGFDLCDTTHCQRVENRWSARASAAARATEGETLRQQGRPILAYYTLDCGGRAEDAGSVWPDEAEPYLRVHEDPYCHPPGSAKWRWEVAAEQLAGALGRAKLRGPRVIEAVTIGRRTGSGRAAELVLAGKDAQVRVAASSLRFAVGRAFGFNSIRSDLYQVAMVRDRVVFEGAGEGHGVGLCQRGADKMGAAGHGYRDILAFYYAGTVIEGVEAWKRLAGERVTVLTMRPEADSGVVAMADKLLRRAEGRVRLAARPGVMLRVYPTVAEFIRSTGEPGWVAARTEAPENNAAREIHLQPVATLGAAMEPVLYHELLHVVLEDNARVELPVWFKEGLAGYLAGERGAAHAVNERDVRQVADAARARAGYEDARRRVGALVARYTEAAVLGWLATGLPREARNAARRQPATKSR